MQDNMSVYAHVRPIHMYGHNFQPDVALTQAASKEQAVEKFQALYEFANESNVSKVVFDRAVVRL